MEVLKDKILAFLQVGNGYGNGYGYGDGNGYGDVQMPIMDGYEATKKIRAMKNKKIANIPIIATTANAFKEDRKLAIDAGMNEHIAKPIDIQKLIAALDKVLN